MYKSLNPLKNCAIATSTGRISVNPPVGISGTSLEVEGSLGGTMALKYYTQSWKLSGNTISSEEIRNSNFDLRDNFANN